PATYQLPVRPSFPRGRSRDGARTVLAARVRCDRDETPGCHIRVARGLTPERRTHYRAIEGARVRRPQAIVLAPRADRAAAAVSRLRPGAGDRIGTLLVVRPDVRLRRDPLPRAGDRRRPGQSAGGRRSR